VNKTKAKLNKRVRLAVKRKAKPLLEAARASGRIKAHAGPSAARSQDFLYGEDGLSR
jgi:hypothetical protein